MPKRPASSSSATPSSQKKKPDPAKPAPPSASADGCVWRPARRTLELTVRRPMEPLPFVGSVELRVVSGAVVVLGHELRASDPPRGVELHSPAGGLPLAIQTASPVSSGARVQLRAAGWRADAAEARERGGWGGGEGEGGAWDDGDDDADAEPSGDDEAAAATAAARN